MCTAYKWQEHEFCIKRLSCWQNGRLASFHRMYITLNHRLIDVHYKSLILHKICLHFMPKSLIVKEKATSRLVLELVSLELLRGQELKMQQIFCPPFHFLPAVLNSGPFDILNTKIWNLKHDVFVGYAANKWISVSLLNSVSGS